MPATTGLLMTICSNAASCSATDAEARFTSPWCHRLDPPPRLHPLVLCQPKPKQQPSSARLSGRLTQDERVRKPHYVASGSSGDIRARAAIAHRSGRYGAQVGRTNFLVEGVSCTGKTTVCKELQRRGYHAINGDTELAYQGDPETGAPTDGQMHEHGTAARIGDI
jgi:hypothetical protein